MLNWFQIPRRATRCHECSTPFLPGSEYYSSLLEKPERIDSCPACFNQEASRGQIFWKGSVPLKKSVQSNRAEEALELLREIIQEEPEMAYILALFLVRQKVLVKRQEVENHLLYEVCDTEEILSVNQVDLTRLDVEALQKEITNRLNASAIR